MNLPYVVEHVEGDTQVCTDCGKIVFNIKSVEQLRNPLGTFCVGSLLDGLLEIYQTSDIEAFYAHIMFALNMV